MSKQPLADQLDQAITDILANGNVMPSSVDASLMDMLQLARELRELPRPGFKAELRSELEGDISMSTQAVQYRAGFRSVTPYIVVRGAAELITFVQQVFGAEETFRAETGPGAIHAEVRIGNSMMMIGGSPDYPGPIKPGTIRVFVDNPDEVYRRALDSGAVSTLEMTESFGERFGCVDDRFGNSWIISTHRADLYVPGFDHTITPFLYAQGAAQLIDFMKQAFGAEELGRTDSPEGKVKHALIKIGDSALATADVREGKSPSPAMLYLYVPDADAVYDRAIRAGAKSIHPPVDQPYGDRNGGVTDAWGNQWYMATPLSRSPQ
jgi:PhnB protein